MNAAIDTIAQRREGKLGYSFFLVFLFLIALSQFLFDYSKTLSLMFLFISLMTVATLTVVSSKIELVFFMFFTILMNILIPFTNDKVFSQLLPFVFFVVFVVKSRLKRTGEGITLIEFSLFLYFVFVLIAVFWGMQLPFLFSEKKGNTGFLARWNLLNTFFVFTVVLLGFKTQSLEFLLEKFYRIFLAVLIAALVIFYFNITAKLPLFNTFSWTIIYEGPESKRMGIAGFAAIYLFIYLICFKSGGRRAWLLFLLIILGVIASGGRSTMLNFFAVVYLGWVIRKKILIRSFVITGIVLVAFLAFSMSPLILKIPPGLQRIFIIFPKEFYSGSLQELANTAAANSSTFRFDMWRKAVPEIKENPMFGQGFGIPENTYSFSKEGMQGLQMKTNEMLYHDFMAGGQLHNTYVSMVYIMGVPAMIFFVYAFIALIFKTYRYYVAFSSSEYGPYLKFLLLILLTSLISSLLGDLHFDLSFFIFFAIAIKTMNYLRSQEIGSQNTTNNASTNI
jgi:hypothetical protein